MPTIDGPLPPLFGGYGKLVFAVFLFASVGVFVYSIATKPTLADATFSEGYEAGKKGVPAEACPYMPGDNGYIETKHEQWKKGWQQGYLERQQEQQQDR